MSERRFPIQAEYDDRAVTGDRMNSFPSGSVPWSVAEKAYAAYFEHYKGQTLERLAERGGFGHWEMDRYHGPGWREHFSESDTQRRLYKLVSLKTLPPDFTLVRGGDPY